MKVGTTVYYKDSLKNAIMTNYIINRAIPLASAYTNSQAEIKNSTTLQATEKAVYLQNLQIAYEQTRDDIFGKLED